MALHQYIGARYVPKFYENSDGTNEWRSGVIYEPLTIVTYNGNSYTSKKPVPANIGNPSANPDYWVATGSYNSQIEQLTEIVEAMGAQVDAASEKADDVERDLQGLTDNIVVLKNYGETLEGYTYTAFSGGAMFAGMELYAFRAAMTHRTDPDNFGKILFYQHTRENKFEKVAIECTYDSATYGELRDTNLSVSRDGSLLFVSCFSTIDDTRWDSHVFIFNKELIQIGHSIIPNSVFWGNTLQTPTGYLIHCDYNEDTLALWRSTAAVTAANASNVAWTKLEPFTLTAGRHYAEPTIGYFNNRLVLLTRTGGTYDSEVSWTFDMEGASGWSRFVGITGNHHAPALPVRWSGRYLPFSSSIIDSALTGSPSKRVPFVGLLSFSDFSYSNNSGIDVICGGLINAPSVGYYGGYSTFVPLSETDFGVMYYDDNTSDQNTLRYQKVSLLGYYGENSSYYIPDAVPEPVVLSVFSLNAYNGAMREWILKALSQSDYAQLEFVSGVGQGSITDKPSGLQSNFWGRAERVSTQYYAEVHYFSSGAPKVSMVTGDAQSFLTNAWVDITA